MPRISSGGTSGNAASDEQIVRVDISPDDIGQMSTEQIYELLAKLRVNRQFTTDKPKRAKKPASEPGELVETIDEDLGDLE
jgi:hypothetical protein